MLSEPKHTSQDQKIVLSLRPAQAADAIGISPRKLWDLTDRGEIPHVRIGRAIVYPVAGLEAWLATQAKGGAT